MRSEPDVGGQDLDAAIGQRRRQRLSHPALVGQDDDREPASSADAGRCEPVDAAAVRPAPARAAGSPVASSSETAASALAARRPRRAGGRLGAGVGVGAGVGGRLG